MSVNLTSFVQLRGIKRDTAIKERKEQARQIDEDISKKGGERCKQMLQDISENSHHQNECSVDPRK